MATRRDSPLRTMSARNVSTLLSTTCTSLRTCSTSSRVAYSVSKLTCRFGVRTKFATERIAGTNSSKIATAIPSCSKLTRSTFFFFRSML
jgi:hypothetical protein